MRTTLDLEDDVLFAAKEIARREDTTLGKVVSELARRSLRRKVEVTKRTGIPQLPFKPEGRVVSLELVNELRDEGA